VFLKNGSDEADVTSAGSTLWLQQQEKHDYYIFKHLLVAQAVSMLFSENKYDNDGIDRRNNGTSICSDLSQFYQRTSSRSVMCGGRAKGQLPLLFKESGDVHLQRKQQEKQTGYHRDRQNTNI